MGPIDLGAPLSCDVGNLLRFRAPRALEALRNRLVALHPREGELVMPKRKPLDPYTLRWCARKAEAEAQLTYDSRDALPAELPERWRVLDSTASALSSFGRFLTTEARALKPAKRTKR